jgi:serine/alanine adding enzyme
MKDNISYTIASENDAIAWDKYVDQHPARTFSHRWGWAPVLANSFGTKPYYIIARHNDAIVGILPLAYMKSRLFGKYLISLPWLDYGGPLADTPEIALGLTDYSSNLARENNCRFVEHRAVKTPIPGLLEKRQKWSFVMDLSGSEEDIWKGIDGKAKNQVRKAEKSNLTVKFGKGELLDDFYKIFAFNMRDLGTPVWPKSLYGEQFHHFKDDTEMAVVMMGEIPIAAALIIHYQDYSAVPSASSYYKYRNLCPNNIMYWEIIKRCRNRGSLRFDFGRSTLNAGTYNFKKQWVKNPVELVWQYKLLTIDDLPELNPSNPKFRLAINVWRRLPLPIANCLGPKIVTKLP